MDGIEGDVYVDANLIAHWAKLGFVEEDVIRNHILQSLISAVIRQARSLSYSTSGCDF